VGTYRRNRPGPGRPRMGLSPRFQRSCIQDLRSPPHRDALRPALRPWLEDGVLLRDTRARDRRQFPAIMVNGRFDFFRAADRLGVGSKSACGPAAPKLVIVERRGATTHPNARASPLKPGFAPRNEVRAPSTRTANQQKLLELGGLHIDEHTVGAGASGRCRDRRL